MHQNHKGEGLFSLNDGSSYANVPNKMLRWRRSVYKPLFFRVLYDRVLFFETIGVR